MGLCSSSANTASGAVAGRKKALDYYVVTKTLGLGASCKVLMVKDKSSGEKYAMKVMEKKDDNDFLFQNEVSILSVLKHNNIVELHEAFEDERSFNIVSKLCIGGELFDRVTDKAGGFSEKIASQLTKQMLLALKHCHHNDVVHRDLKPENFVFDGPSEDANMKLIDFGCAVKAKDDEIIKDVAGSPYYVAPEVLITYDHQKKPIKRTCKMWKASDMWSIGIIIYLLVHGYPPFNGQKEADIFRKILRGKYKFSSKAKLSSEVKDLIRKLLIKDPFKRLTVDEALSHPWIASNVAPDTALPSFVIKGVEDFRDQCRLKKAVARAMLKHMSDKDQQALEEAFQKWDLNGDGKLSPDEIAQMMKSIGKNAEDAKELMNQIDDDGDGFIDKDEFATLQALEMLEKMNASDQDKFYRDQFRKFDVDGDGEVTHQEIQRVDKNNDGKISFKEWMNAMGNAR